MKDYRRFLLANPDYPIRSQREAVLDQAIEYMQSYTFENPNFMRYACLSDGDEESLAKLLRETSPGLAMLYVLWILQAELYNGGVAQFFLNVEAFARHVAPALARAGCPEAGESFLAIIEKRRKSAALFDALNANETPDWHAAYRQFANSLEPEAGAFESDLLPSPVEGRTPPDSLGGRLGAAVVAYVEANRHEFEFPAPGAISH